MKTYSIAGLLVNMECTGRSEIQAEKYLTDVKMYNVAGICVGTYAFEVGYNDVKMPSEAGVYTMQVVYNSDKISK